MNLILFIGGLLGLSSVIMAALIDHYFIFHLASPALTSILTAVRYHQFYAMIIVILGLIIPVQTNNRIRVWLIIAACLFLIGVILFSFSIYLSLIFMVPRIMYLAPTGGVVIMIGWTTIIRVSILKRCHQSKVGQSQN